MSLVKALHKRLGVPRGAVRPLVVAARVVTNPVEYKRRRATAAQIAAGPVPEMEVPVADGHRRFGPGAVPGAGAVVDSCRAIYERARRERSPESMMPSVRKTFLVPILEESDAAQHPELIRFMVSRPVLDVASRYLCTVPVLASAHLYWSPPNEFVGSSQSFHVDYEDTTQLKVFVNILETRADQGPLTYLPAAKSDLVTQRLGQRERRFSDEEVRRASGGEPQIEVVGPPGSGTFLDTSRCLHFGSRANRRDRVVLMFQFLRPQSAYRPLSGLRLRRPPAGLSLDPAQRLALRQR